MSRPPRTRTTPAIRDSRGDERPAGHATAARRPPWATLAGPDGVLFGRRPRRDQRDPTVDQPHARAEIRAFRHSRFSVRTMTHGASAG